MGGKGPAASVAFSSVAHPKTSVKRIKKDEGRETTNYEKGKGATACLRRTCVSLLGLHPGKRSVSETQGRLDLESPMKDGKDLYTSQNPTLFKGSQEETSRIQKKGVGQATKVSRNRKESSLRQGGKCDLEPSVTRRTSFNISGRARARERGSKIFGRVRVFTVRKTCIGLVPSDFLIWEVTRGKSRLDG